MISIILLVGIILVTIFTISAKKFLPKIGINSKFYLIILVTSAFFSYLLYTTEYGYVKMMELLYNIFHQYNINDISFIYSIVIGLSYIIFTYLYSNIIVKSACLNKIHKYILTIIASIIALTPLLLYTNTFNIDNIKNVKIITQLISILFLIYSIYIHIKFIQRFNKNSNNMTDNIFYGILVWLFGGPIVFTLLTIKGGENYVPCDKELSKNTEEKKEDIKQEL